MTWGVVAFWYDGVGMDGNMEWLLSAVVVGGC